MCKAMNRSLANVILGGYESFGSGEAMKIEGTVTRPLGARGVFFCVEVTCRRFLCS